MFKLEAPWPALQVLTILPNPEFSDHEARLSTVSRGVAMDGTSYTYVKRRTRRKLNWSFRLTRNKWLELREFYLLYAAARVRITDHRGRVWLGYLTSNPIEAEVTSRAAPAVAPLSRGETVAVEIEFEGELV